MRSRKSWIEKSLPQLAVVVDLAVVDHREAAGVRQHRLRAGLGQVHDREPPVAEDDFPVVTLPRPAGVRPAVQHALFHALDILFRSLSESDQSGDSAHI